MLTGQRASLPALMLIAGGGGIGKTGLAVYWSRRVAAQFPDGQFFADLRGYSDRDEPVTPAAVLELFLRALGMAGDSIPAGLDARVALFRSRLAGRRALLVLDDAVSSDQVRPLLPGTDGCCVLVTSRQRLDGLIAKDGARYLPLGPLDHQDAVALLQRFTEQAQAPLDRDTAVRVSATASTQITPIDTATNTARPAIHVAPRHGVDVSTVVPPDGTIVYAGGEFPSGNGFVVPVSIATGTAGKAIIIGGFPFEMAVTPDSKTLYALGRDVYPVDTATSTLGTPINTGAGPDAIAITDGHQQR